MVMLIQLGHGYSFHWGMKTYSLQEKKGTEMRNRLDGKRKRPIQRLFDR